MTHPGIQIQGKTGIQWTWWTQLEDQDCADDLHYYRTHNSKCMPKWNGRGAGSVGLRINKGQF